MSKQFDLATIGEHNNKKDVWTIIHGKVYDITKFLDEVCPFVYALVAVLLIECDLNPWYLN
jgi:hypothetical protein